MSRLIPLYTPTDDQRTLEAAWLLCPGGIPRNTLNGYVVDLEVAGGNGNRTRVGRLDLRSQAIPVGGRLRLTGAQRLGRALASDGVLVASVQPYGSPSLAAGLSVQALIGTSARPPAHRTSDDSMRDAADSLSDHVRTVGAGEQVVVVPVVRVGDDDGTVEQTDRDETDQDVTSTSYVDGLVESNVVLPSWATRARVRVRLQASFQGLVGAGAFYMAISDGTADRNEELENTILATNMSCSTTYTTTVWRNARFVARFKMGTNNVRVTAQTMTLFAEFS